MNLKTFIVVFIVVVLLFNFYFAKQKAINMKGKPKGTLYIVSAASGTGKTSLIESLVKDTKNIKFSISHTTRQVRGNEIDGQDYFFVSKEEFENLIKRDEFLEYAKVFDEYYGTSRTWVEEQLDLGVDVVLDIDWQGARQIREKIECTTIFLLPPSKMELRSRLEKRGRDGSEIIEKRLAAASSEISHYKEFDYVVINDSFNEALMDLRSIINGKRLSSDHQKEKYDALVEELLGNL